MTTKVIKGQKYRVSGHGLLFQNNIEVTAKTDANEVALVMDKSGKQRYVPVENLIEPFVALSFKEGDSVKIVGVSHGVNDISRTLERTGKITEAYEAYSSGNPEIYPLVRVKLDEPATYYDMDFYYNQADVIAWSQFEVGTRVIVKSSTYYPNDSTKAKVDTTGVVTRRPENRNYWKQDIQVVRVEFSDGGEWSFRTTDVEVFDDSIGLDDAVEIIDSTCCPQELTKGKIGSRGTVTLVREVTGIPRSVNVRFSDGQEWAYNIDDVKKVCKVPLANDVEFGFNDHATAVSVKEFCKNNISMTIISNELVSDDGTGKMIVRKSTQEESNFSLTYPEAKKLVGILQQMIDKKENP